MMELGSLTFRLSTDTTEPDKAGTHRDPNLSMSFSSNVKYILNERKGKNLRPNTLHNFKHSQGDQQHYIPVAMYHKNILDSGSKPGNFELPLEFVETL